MECAPKSRLARAFEGAGLGAVIGLLGGVIAGGILLAIDRDDITTPLFLSLGIFGVAVISQAVTTAAPPEC